MASLQGSEHCLGSGSRRGLLSLVNVLSTVLGPVRPRGYQTTTKNEASTNPKVVVTEMGGATSSTGNATPKSPCCACQRVPGWFVVVRSAQHEDLLTRVSKCSVAACRRRAAAPAAVDGRARRRDNIVAAANLSLCCLRLCWPEKTDPAHMSCIMNNTAHMSNTTYPLLIWVCYRATCTARIVRSAL